MDFEFDKKYNDSEDFRYAFTYGYTPKEREPICKIDNGLSAYHVYKSRYEDYIIIVSRISDFIIEAKPIAGNMYRVTGKCVIGSGKYDYSDIIFRGIGTKIPESFKLTNDRIEELDSKTIAKLKLLGKW